MFQTSKSISFFQTSVSYLRSPSTIATEAMIGLSMFFYALSMSPSPTPYQPLLAILLYYNRPLQMKQKKLVRPKKVKIKSNIYNNC